MGGIEISRLTFGHAQIGETVVLHTSNVQKCTQLTFYTSPLFYVDEMRILSILLRRDERRASEDTTRILPVSDGMSNCKDNLNDYMQYLVRQ